MGVGEGIPPGDVREGSRGSDPSRRGSVACAADKRILIF